MAVNNVTLTSAQRSNIQTLRDIQQLSDRTTERLSTGRKVNNVVDDAAAYFTSEGLYGRVTDMLERKDSVEQGISTLEASLDSINAIMDLLQQMKGIAEAAKSQTTAERISSTETFEQIATQIGYMVKDSSYTGLNMLDKTNSKLDVRFSEFTYSRLTVGGFRLASTQVQAANTISRQIFTSAAFSSLGKFIGMSTIADGTLRNSFTNIGANNSQIGSVDTLLQTLDDGLAQVRGIAAQLGSNISILQVRSDFTDNYTQTLSVGGDKLVLADMNEEGANLTALQTSQQIAIQSLAISGDQAASILTLLA